MQNSTALKQNYHQSLSQSPSLKRFFERWIADPKFRENLLKSPEETLERYHIDVDIEKIRYIIDDMPALIHDDVKKLWEVAAKKQELVTSFYLEENVPSDPGMLAWRKRQINRQRLDLGSYFTDTNIHSSLTVELSQGCSVGCWFCALSPESFKEYYDHDIYKEEWQGFIKYMNSFLGNAFKTTFLYWATEPLDNPFYEQFCIDIYNECGVFPPTTTAVAHKQVERIKDFITLSAGYDCWQNRFSITALGLLSKVHKAYSSEELAEIECITLNKKSSYAFGNAGEFRERAKKDPSLLKEQDEKIRTAYWHSTNPGYAESEDYANGSICCVTGFLVNMVSKRIQLISPITASDEWPMGYIIFAEANFSSNSELEEIIKKWGNEFFIEKLEQENIIQFHPHLSIEETDDNIALRGRFNQKVIFDKNNDKETASLIKIIWNSKLSVKEAAQKAYAEYGIGTQDALSSIHQLFSNGLFYGY